LTAHNRRDYEGQKGKLINVNYWWNMGYTSTKSRYFINDWYLGQIFLLYTCNYGFIIFTNTGLKCWSDENFHHWSRHVHRQRIALWIISLVLATQHTYIQSMLNLERFISFLLCKSLLSRFKCKNIIRAKTNRGKTSINIWITKIRNIYMGVFW
jgi:hypothetical protein